MNTEKATKDAEFNVIVKALRHQDRLNCELSPNWAKKGWAYQRAVWTEMAEAIMHTNWPWWKANRYNMSLTMDQNVLLHGEFADILHFMMSASMIGRGLRDDDLEVIAGIMQRDYALSEDYRSTDSYPESLSKCMEEVVADAAGKNGMNYVSFFAACRMSLLDMPKLLGLYFGKAALNKFRWANGYKEGTYVKQWRRGDTTVEDNTYLDGYVHALLQGQDGDKAKYEFLLSPSYSQWITGKIAAGYMEHARR